MYFLWRAYRTRKRRAEEVAPDSIVLLMAAPVPLNAQYLSIVVSRAIGHEVPSIDIDQEAKPALDDPQVPANCVVGKPPHFILAFDGRMFMVHSLPDPYVDPLEFKDRYRELRIRNALETHTAWLSVDSVGTEPNPESHRAMGKIAAEFLGPNCLALYHPATEKIIPVTAERLDELQAKLRGETPVEDLFGPESMFCLPVIPVEDDDPRMVAAIEEARRRLPEFEQSFLAAQGRDGSFAVKTKLESGGNAEHIWVDVVAIENGRISGTLGNEPVSLEGYRLGSRVDVARSEVEDWCILREGQDPLGAFTMAAIQEIESTKGN